MEIKYFRLIKTIAEEGNIANSSEKLFLTQSALSHQLREVEERLGFKVFLRTRNQWKLTEEGQELYQLAKEVLHTIEQGFHKIQYIREGSKGTVRISTECYSFYQGVAAFIQKMGWMYPEIKVELILEATHQPVSKLLAKEIDIAIVTAQPSSNDLLSIPIFEDEIFAILHQENPLCAKEFLVASDFLNTHLIIHSFPLETVSVYEHFLKPNQILPVKISAIPMTEVSLELVAANQGMMCLPKWALKPFRLSEDLHFKSLGQYGVKRTHYLVVRKSDIGKKYMMDFIENFQDTFVQPE